MSNIHFPQLHQSASAKEEITGYCFLNWVGEPFYGYDVPEVRGFGPVEKREQLEPLVELKEDEDGNLSNEYFEHDEETPSHIVPILNPINKDSFVWYYGYKTEGEQYYDGKGNVFVMLWYLREPMSEFDEARVFGPFNTEMDAKRWFQTTGFYEHMDSDHDCVDECEAFITLLPFDRIPLKKPLDTL